MAAETPDSTEVRPRAPAWQQWLQVAALAVGLLVVSEVVWLWQTWPVRELLQSASTPAARTTGR